MTFGVFRNSSIGVKTAVDIIKATFGKIWATYLLQHLVTLVMTESYYLSSCKSECSYASPQPNAWDSNHRSEQTTVWLKILIFLLGPLLGLWPHVIDHLWL